MTTPRMSTIKRLFAVSGNQCAFPGCPQSLVDTNTGKVTGKICHIKARSPRWPRYDPSQTNEERHAFENLLLMCQRHHDIIDFDVETYTVEKLQEIKQQHEAQSSGEPTITDELARQLQRTIHEIDIEQAGNTLTNVTGAEISNPPSDIVLGKVRIQQRGRDMKNVTGMKMEFNSDSREVNLVDKFTISQEHPGGRSSIQINADDPNAEVMFNKQSCDCGEPDERKEKHKENKPTI